MKKPINNAIKKKPINKRLVKDENRQIAKRVTLTPNIMRKISDLMANGESLIRACDNPKFPHYRTVTSMVLKDDELWKIYKQGRMLQAEYYGDKINDLAQQPLPVDAIDPKHMNAEVQRRRLEIDTLKWTYARMYPSKLRENPSADGSANGQQGTMVIQWSNVEPTMLANTIANNIDNTSTTTIDIEPDYS